MRLGRAAAFLCFSGLWSQVALFGCAGVERGQYGVGTLRFERVEQVNERALAACLLTLERESFAIELGAVEHVCNEPPFDGSDARLALWTWPWTDWPAFNPAVFEKDKQRILRWYRARGFYQARIVEVRTNPPHAANPEIEVPAEACDPRKEQCEVEIVVVVDEGRPVLVESVRVTGGEELPAGARRLLAGARLPRAGERFDEADHDEAKRSLVGQLSEASYAGARVTATIEVDTARRRARLTYRLHPGKSYRFGKVTVRGHGSRPEGPIRDAAAIEPGARYRHGALAEAEREVLALEAFSRVEVERRLAPEESVADIEIRVEPLRPHVFRLGLGVMSGAMRRTASGSLASVPQWDAHLFARYEMRKLFGGLGKLRLEERPRIIMNDSFPRTTPPRFGNIVEASVRQPAFPERRTILTPGARWDWGPDPFLGFDRSDVLLRVGLERPLYQRLLLGGLAVQQDFFLVADGETTSDGSELPESYGFRFLEEDLRLELRDDVVQPTRGVFAQLLASQSLEALGSSWTLFRLSPDLRGYLPLPFGMVIACRLALAALFVTSADPDLDALSQQLGPQPYRLRGGGAYSNRGFRAGRLGDGLQGGLRRWEGSLELRVRLGEDFSLVVFGDTGDVHRGRSYRFLHLNASAGFGLRYLTLVGPIRFDVGFRIPGLQKLDGSGDIEAEAERLPLIESPGALHLTIGEAF